MIADRAAGDGPPLFAERWPALERRLRRALRAMNVPEACRDDVIQETSLRLYLAWDRIDHDRPLWPLVKTMARRSAVDEARRSLECVSEVPEGLARDAETEALARLEAERVGAALSRLSERDRQILLAEINEADAPALGRSALKMRRLRARQRLLALLGEARPAFVVLPLRRLWASVYVRLAPASGSMRDGWLAAVAAGTNVLIAGVLLQVPPSGGPSPERAPRDARVAQLSRALRPDPAPSAAATAAERAQDRVAMDRQRGSSREESAVIPPAQPPSTDEDARRISHHGTHVGGVGGAEADADEKGGRVQVCASEDPTRPGTYTDCDDADYAVIVMVGTPQQDEGNRQP